MNDTHLPILRRAGLVILACAALDIGWNIYTLMTAQTFKLGATLLLVVAAAIMLMRGNLRVARWTVWLVALMLAWNLGNLLFVLPFSMPADLWRAQLRLNGTGTLTGVAVQVLSAMILFWLYRQLQRPEVQQARRSAGQLPAPPSSAFILGTLAAAIVSLGLFAAQYGEAGARAVRLAQAQAGSGYRYHVAGLNWSGKGIKADVTAFNDREIRSLRVEWPH